MNTGLTVFESANWLQDLMTEETIVAPGLAIAPSLYSYSPIEYLYLDPEHSAFPLALASGATTLGLKLADWIAQNQHLLSSELQSEKKTFSMLCCYISLIVTSGSTLQNYRHHQTTIIRLVATLGHLVRQYFSFLRESLPSTTETDYPSALLSLHRRFGTFLYAANVALKPLSAFLGENQCVFNVTDFFMSVYRVSVIAKEADRISAVVCSRLEDVVSACVQYKESNTSLEGCLFCPMTFECKAMIGVLSDCSLCPTSVALLFAPHMKLGSIYQQFEKVLVARLKSRLALAIQGSVADDRKKEPIWHFILRQVLLPMTMNQLTV